MKTYPAGRGLLDAFLVSLLLCNIITCITASLATTDDPDDDHWGGKGVPASFDCAMRQAAYSYGKKLMPRQGQFASLYYALNLNAPSCHVELGEEAEEHNNDKNIDIITNKNQEESTDNTMTTTTKSRRLRSSQDMESMKSIPKDAVYVAPALEKTSKVKNDFNDGNGKQETPFRNLQMAFDHASLNSKSKVVVVREGTYFLNETLLLTSQHSGLKVVAFPGETPVVSGGVQLCVDQWTQWKPRRKAVNKNDNNNANTDSNSNIWKTNLGNQLQKDMPGLQINGVRSTVARYPNLPGGIEVSCGYGCMIDGRQAKWTPPRKFETQVQYYTDNTTEHTRGPNAGWFEHYTIGAHGNCDVYDPPVSYWCSEHPSGGGAFAFRTPSGLQPTNLTQVLPNAPYQHAVEDARVFVWRPARWANWMFEVADYDPTTGNITFGKGGNQGARGENNGGDWFVENVLEELDSPNEFFYDTRTHDLYLWYNATTAGTPPPKDAVLVVPQLRTLMKVDGTQWDPVKDLAIQGITFTASRFTYLDAHGVPSGGDWALERDAAVFLQGTQHVTIQDCVFNRLDSNGLMISGYNRNTTVRGSDFSYIGGTAIASWGYTNETGSDPGRPGVHLENAPQAGVDGTDGEHPRYNTIEGCTIREVGLYEKQASFYMQAKTAYTTLKGNVFFNGPRAGINFNDGFCGGDEVTENLVFSTCRESGDHGPFNSWDRQPFLTLKDGQSKATMFPEWRRLHHNFFIDNYSMQENVDNDDGSIYFHTHDNFFVYGGNGMKNDFGGHDNHHYRNVYAYAYQVLGICDQLKGHEDHFENNRAILLGQKVGNFKCGGDGSVIMKNNTYYTKDGKVEECKMALEDWQKQGGDPGSKVQTYPKDEEIISWAQDLLGF